MVGVLDSGSRGLGSNPDWGHCIVILTRHLTPTVHLSTQVCGLLVKLMLGGRGAVMGGGVEMHLVTS